MGYISGAFINLMWAIIPLINPIKLVWAITNLNEGIFSLLLSNRFRSDCLFHYQTTYKQFATYKHQLCLFNLQFPLLDYTLQITHPIKHVS